MNIYKPILCLKSTVRRNPTYSAMTAVNEVRPLSISCIISASVGVTTQLWWVTSDEELLRTVDHELACI